MSLREELQAIYDLHGKLTPRLVVDMARDAGAFPTLHQRLDWDDLTAAEAWRREQARELIRSVKVVYRSPETNLDNSVRGFHAVRTQKGYVYEPLDRVMQEPFLRQLVFADMEREWRQLKKRYEDFTEFWEVVKGDLPPAQAA